MRLPSSKITIITLGVLVVGLAGLNIYQYTRPHPFPLAKDAKEINVHESEDLAVPNIVADKKLPEGTISPSELADKREQYAGKEVKVRGVISGDAKEGYVIADQEGEKRYAFSISPASSDIDFEKYVIKPPVPGQSPQQIKPITVVGILEVTQSSTEADRVNLAAVVKVSSVLE